MTRNASKLTKRPTIALLLDWFSNQYLLDIWTGVTQAAQSHNTNVIAILGGRLKKPDAPETGSNMMYQMANAKNVDGILIASSSIFSHLTTGERLTFLEQFQPLPIVLIGEQLAGFSSVSVDNATGLRDVLVHLIVDHGCRRLAFISGPKQNWEATQRLNVYKAVLKEHQIPIDERLIYYGDFMKATAVEAVEYFYAQGLMPCDAIVAANDYMATGALSALQARGVLVPDDILITGFDNFEDSHLSVPTITTVHQPITAMAHKAFELLLAHLKDEKRELQNVILPTKGMIRQSCGCYGIIHLAPPADTETVESQTAVNIVPDALPDALKKQRPQLLREIEKIFDQSLFGQFDSAWARLLFDAYVNSWRSDEPGILLAAIESISQRMIRRELNIQVLADCTNVLFRYSRQITTEANVLKKLDDRQLQARLTIDTLVQRGDLKYRFNIFMRDLRVRLFSERLLKQKDLHGAFEEMSQSLPGLGVSRFYLVLYDQQTMPDDHETLPQWSYLAYAHDDSGSVTPNFQEQRFLTAELLPGYLRALDQFTKLLLFPLYSNTQQFGYLIMEIDAEDSRYHYDLIRAHVSLALQSLLPKLKLMADRNQLETEVTNKAYELALANEQLKAYTAELERRNWELQQFAHVAQNELQEPLRNIRSLGDRLQTQYMPILAERGNHYVARMQNASARMQALIDDLLLFTQVTNQPTTSLNQVDLNQVVDNVLETLNAEIIAVNGRIHADTLPIVEANSSQMYQLFYNLIHNALKFHRKGVPPVVLIKSQPLNEDTTLPQNLWEITVADNGIGFDKKYRERIFSMFQRVHFRENMGGTGIGLAVCRRVVELHNGTITASSKKNKGTTFFIILPNKQS